MGKCSIELPEGFIDDSQANEECPKFTNTTLGLSIWISEDSPKYALSYEHDFKTILEANEYLCILAAINTIDYDYYIQRIESMSDIKKLRKLTVKFTARYLSRNTLAQPLVEIAMDLRSIAKVLDAAGAKHRTLWMNDK